MAETQEVDLNSKGGEEATQEQNTQASQGFIQSLINAMKKDKMILIALILGALSLVMFIVVFVVFFLTYFGEKPTEDIESLELQKPPVVIEPTPPVYQLSKKGGVDDTELGDMIKKANLFYEQGDKTEALNLFEHISIFSQSLASYNLGVIKLKEGQYDKAIASFDNAINAGEDVAVSALNAAYAAHKLNRLDLMDYYLGISYSHLHQISHQPLYSYLYSLIDIYRGFYFEGFSSLLNPNSQSYDEQNSKLASRLFVVFDDDFNALQSLKKSYDKRDNLAIALLHSRLGEYKQARQYLYEYLGSYPDDFDALMALQLVEIKLGNFRESAMVINRAIQKNENALNTYPIRIKLKESLFDINVAQENFWNRRFEHENILSYKILYYYAPMRVFDAKGALENIQDSSLSAKVRNVQIAKSSLSEGGSLSKVNQQIIFALREFGDNNLRKAKEIMNQALTMYPNHSILHYNIALIHAQMGDYDNAYQHFLRAYHLDSNDVLSGLFAVIAGKLTYRNTDRIVNSISADFEDIAFEDSTHKEFLLCFLRYLNNVPIDSFAFIEQSRQKKPIFYALQSVYALMQDNQELARESFGKLKELFPNDAVSNIMAELTKFYKQDLKEVALELNEIYKKGDIDMNSVYFGPNLARELYIYTAFVTGALQSIEPEIEAKFLSQESDSSGILQVLGLLNIYTHEYEKALVYYNTLIDEYKEDDSATKFLGAVAALGAGRHENAIALLQIAKIESDSNLESRFALGLLYQEAKNFKAAGDHYNKIATQNFVSEYFDFEIDSSEMLNAYQLQSN